MFRFFDSTVTFSNDLETAKIQYNFFGIKISFKVKKHPIFNKYLCNKAGFKTVLIARFSGVGDFLLFRPFIKSLKMSKKFAGYKIILITHPEYIELNKRFDGDVVDYYIPITADAFKQDYKKVRSILKGASFNAFIDAADGLNIGTRDSIVQTIKADDKYCNIGIFTYSAARKNGVNIDGMFEKDFNHVYYNPDAPMFVKDENKAFMEYVLEEKITDVNSFKTSPELSVDFKSKYVVISPFARGKDRAYGFKNYAVVIDYITGTLNIPVVILGSKEEKKISKSLVWLCKNKDKITDLTGKLSYFESLFYIKNASLLVANETGTVHMAQELGTKIVCISNGTYMGTFHPYPKEISSAVYVYPDDINEILEVHPEYVGVPFRSTFEKLPVQKVIEAINSII